MEAVLWLFSILFSAPFPGGCCLTCNMEFDPNIVISYDAVETNVTFSFANVYYGRSVIFHILNERILFHNSMLKMVIVF